MSESYLGDLGTLDSYELGSMIEDELTRRTVGHPDIALESRYISGALPDVRTVSLLPSQVLYDMIDYIVSRVVLLFKSEAGVLPDLKKGKWKCGQERAKGGSSLQGDSRARPLPAMQSFV